MKHTLLINLLKEDAAQLETVALSRCADRIKLSRLEQERDELRKDAEKERDRLKHKIQSLCVLADLKPASDASESLCLLHQHIQELASMADELRKDAELGECIREKFRLMKVSTAVRFLGCLGVNEPEGGFDWSKTVLELIDAAIAQGQTK